MLNSLILGPDALEQTSFTESYKLPNGTLKTRKKHVVKLKDTVTDPCFGIGHSSSQSETFFPSTVKKDGVLWIDVAGLNDTGGVFIDLICCFMTK